jgi:hypothetical protein
MYFYTVKGTYMANSFEDMQHLINMNHLGENRFERFEREERMKYERMMMNDNIPFSPHGPLQYFPSVPSEEEMFRKLQEKMHTEDLKEAASWYDRNLGYPKTKIDKNESKTNLPSADRSEQGTKRAKGIGKGCQKRQTATGLRLVGNAVRVGRCTRRTVEGKVSDTVQF